MEEDVSSYWMTLREEDTVKYEAQTALFKYPVRTAQ